MALDIQISEASGVPFYRQIVDRVSDLVRAGTLAPVTRMPSVRELAMELRVSLITIRRAYAELEQAGLVVRRQGQGTFVADNVGAAARRQARQDAREALERGVDRALDLGLSRGEVESFVHQHLEDRGGSDA
ncbi:MAG: GntR family transcriptional regulator [Myxococcota bacterium]|nr:GntR family transcriptional regulator [Myxococcota bacterium]